MKFCSDCGGRVKLGIPDDDDRMRYICEECRIVHYQNPKMVVGCIPVWEDRILLCRRAISPRYGYWTLPAGYLENGETVSSGARREAMEEACARVGDLTPYCLFNLSFINQVYFMFRGDLQDRDCRPGTESLEVRLFAEEEIPWDEIAFTVVRETLRHFYYDRASGFYRFHMGDIAPDHRPFA